MGRLLVVAPLLLLLLLCVRAFRSNHVNRPTTTRLLMAGGRREFLGYAAAAAATGLFVPFDASANVYLDPAMYGDQENRVAAVDTLRERVRQAILRNPSLAPTFFEMALLDGLSYNAKTKQFGPDGRVVRSIFASKETNAYTQNMQEAATVLVQSTKDLKKYTAITIGDAVALGGAEAIESIGGPVLSVQLGRTEPPRDVPLPTLPLNLFDGGMSTPELISSVFETAGLTGREMTALLGALLTLDRVEKSRSPGDWKASAKTKFRERGKIGRMSEFKRLTDEEIANMEEDYEYDPDDGWYIADSFGTREDAFGQRIAKDDLDQKTFNRYIKDLRSSSSSSNNKQAEGWIERILLDKDKPTIQSWLNKYAGSNLNYLKDLGIAYNAVTQLGAEYTGGKYESLLKNKPRKSLNDDDLNLF